MFHFLDPMFFIVVGPAMLLGLYAQYRVKSTFAAAHRQPAALSGAAAARHILDEAGLNSVGLEQVGGRLSDHYDPRHKVLRLSSDVYNGRTLAAVGIAAHEAGHALQDAKHYLPLSIRNAAVPAAQFGSNAAMMMFLGGILLSMEPLIWVGIIAFGATVFFQVVNLPVEFNASSRAKALLVERGIVPREQMVYVNKVLDAAALTYVAATLQAILTLLYYIWRFTGSRD